METPIINALLIYQLTHVTLFYLLENISEEDYKVLNCLKDQFVEEADLQVIDDALSSDIRYCKSNRKDYYCKWVGNKVELPIYKPCINLVYYYDAR